MNTGAGFDTGDLQALARRVIITHPFAARSPKGSHLLAELSALYAERSNLDPLADQPDPNHVPTTSGRLWRLGIS
jgi:hypothetical protein